MASFAGESRAESSGTARMMYQPGLTVKKGHIESPGVQRVGVLRPRTLTRRHHTNRTSGCRRGGGQVGCRLVWIELVYRSTGM